MQSSQTRDSPYGSKFSMDPMHIAAHEKEPDAPKSRPWGMALLSGTVFGGLAAAATHWVGLHSQPFIMHGKKDLFRNWATAAAGLSAGAIAVYGALRSAEEPPKGIENDRPGVKIAASDAEHHGNAKIASPGERSV